ncbi:MAG TPA: DUF1343 domain-containing protein [Candidatus Kapabacteria bacterium]
MLATWSATIAKAQVLTGLDNLVTQHFAPMKGKRVGLITNQTGRTKDGRFGPDLFAHSTAIRLVALFAPEHGLMGTRTAGVNSDTAERYDGVPVYSLYGSTRKPTKKMLKGIDALVFDIQDVGVRPYTFLSTMIDAMEAAAENHIAFYVLDRPDPLSGERIEGNILDSTLESFIGIIPIPYIHGMTLGELAKMATAKGWFQNASKLTLTVLPMIGWTRAMYWNETGLTWVPSSPNVPHFENAVGLAMLGATGELSALSVGIGSDAPFLRIGSTLLPSSEIQRMADSAFSHSLELTPQDFIATTSAGTKTYHGVKIGFRNVKTIPSLYNGQFRMIEEMLADTAFRTSFDALNPRLSMTLEKVTGERAIFETLKRCEDLDRVFSAWNRDDETFRTEREPFLIYP